MVIVDKFEFGILSARLWINNIHLLAKDHFIKVYRTMPTGWCQMASNAFHTSSWNVAEPIRKSNAIYSVPLTTGSGVVTKSTSERWTVGWRRYARLKQHLRGHKKKRKKEMIHFSFMTNYYVGKKIREKWEELNKKRDWREFEYLKEAVTVNTAHRPAKVCACLLSFSFFLIVHFFFSLSFFCCCYLWRRDTSTLWLYRSPRLSSCHSASINRIACSQL